MAKVFIEETTLTNIGNAIRDKEGSSALIPVTDMATRIAAISGGGDAPGIPAAAFNITGDGSNYFSGGNWDWFIKMYGNKVTTSGINTAYRMFYYTQVTEIPFQININPTCGSLNYMFNYATELKVCPKVRCEFAYQGTLTSFDAEAMIEDCKNMRDFEDLFESTYTEKFNSLVCTSAFSINKVPKFQGCYSLRQLPSWYYNFRISPESTTYPYYSYSPLYRGFYNCFVIDELVDLPIWRCNNAELTSNIFYESFNHCNRLKTLTFETDNGTPYTVRWQGQYIDLSNYLGYAYSASRVTDYNSGITSDKEAYDWASYNQVKNDPDWFSTNVEYSRYNHDSAVATINSLPDTSAYLAESGGTNTIRFREMSGYGTDQNGVNALTPEEIGIAAAKGWTVTFV